MYSENDQTSDDALFWGIFQGRQYNQTQHFAMWRSNSLLLLTLLPQSVHAWYIFDVGL